MKVSKTLFCLSVFLTLSFAVNALAQVTVEDLFQKFDGFDIKLSPDGKQMVFIYAYDQEKRQRDSFATYALAIMDVDTRKTANLYRDKSASVYAFEWVADNRLMAWMWGSGRQAIYSYDTNGQNFIELISPKSGSTVQNRAALLRWATVIPSQTLPLGNVYMARDKTVERYEKKRPWAFDGMQPLPGIYQLNTYTGDITLVQRDPGYTMNWYADKQGVIRVATGYDPAAFTDKGEQADYTKLPDERLCWFDDNKNPRPMTGIILGKDERFRAMGFDCEGKKFLFAGRQGNDRAAVYAYLPQTDTVEGPLVSSDVVDIENPILSPFDNTVAGIRYWDGAAKTVWLDPHLKSLQADIDAALPEFTNTFTSWSRDYQRLLILSESAQEPGRYYLFDQKSGKLEEVYRRAAWLKGKALGETKPVSLEARDGVALHGYITRPPGKTEKDRLPTVLHVHGGPWGVRDYDGYDPVKQFFATRGYAVLEINYRGSGGYGRKFFELSRKQMNLTMQTDLYDAVDWAVAKGYSDPDKLIVAGTSYGGYATLCALTGVPDKFKAGISFMPVSDILQQIAGYERHDKAGIPAATWWKEWAGDPEKDKDLLREASPINYISRIKAPLFFVYGEADDRIEYAQNKQLVERLDYFKKKFVRYAPSAEGHGLSREANRIKVYKALDAFLKTHAPVE